MTAQPIEPAAHGMWTPDPVRQRLANHTIEDVLALPDDAPRVELRDGVLVVVPSPTFGHQNIGNLLWMWLRQFAPVELTPATAVGVAINYRNSLEPDVVLLKRPVAADHHYFEAEQVVLAVEVVSPGTRRRDRLEKPADFADAGVPHYWRIEQNPVHVYAYDLVDGRYELAADSAEELIVAKPFDIRLRVRDITP
ncbi:Uma2 family endonuclease [Micromonospora lupini]|uniref:Uma2 family endonuclease n=1 Tax=Micromonospora lupini TaxID=285679 RepID=UPI00225C0DE5|nr:Uma2 family endonuclease [Micromonospora lupini]MCX5069141.1 Uma2 family endonuclease [Micromonospora lupini]